MTVATWAEASIDASLEGRDDPARIDQHLGTWQISRQVVADFATGRGRFRDLDLADFATPLGSFRDTIKEEVLRKRERERNNTHSECGCSLDSSKVVVSLPLGIKAPACAIDLRTRSWELWTSLLPVPRKNPAYPTRGYFFVVSPRDHLGRCAPYGISQGALSVWLHILGRGYASYNETIESIARSRQVDRTTVMRAFKELTAAKLLHVVEARKGAPTLYKVPHAGFKSVKIYNNADGAEDFDDEHLVSDAVLIPKVWLAYPEGISRPPEFREGYFGSLDAAHLNVLVALCRHSRENLLQWDTQKRQLARLDAVNFKPRDRKRRNPMDRRKPRPEDSFELRVLNEHLDHSVIAHTAGIDRHRLPILLQDLVHGHHLGIVSIEGKLRLFLPSAQFATDVARRQYRESLDDLQMTKEL